MDFYQNAYFATPQGFAVLTGFVFVFGCCVGSFLNVVIWRVPLGESIVTAPSHCPKCQAHIPWYLNVPILAWLALRGKCRSCKAPISARYPLVEALTGVLFLLVWWRAWYLYDTSTGPEAMAKQYLGAWPLAKLLLNLYLVSMLVAVTYIDFDTMEIPEGINYTTLVIGVTLAVFVPTAFELSGPPMHIDALRHLPVLQSFGALLVLLWPEVLTLLRPWSILNSFLGVVFGGGFLWLLLEAGKRYMGQKHYRVYEPVILRLTPKGYDNGIDGEQLWEDVFTRETDVLEITGEVTAVQWAHKGKTLQFQPSFNLNEPMELACNGDYVMFGDDVVGLQHIKELHVRTSEWIQPREVFGFGDVMLLGAMGACMGPGAMIFVLVLSSVLGAIGGVSMALLGSTRLYRHIPFGPYIAAAGVLYILLGPEIGAWYLQVSNHVLESIGFGG